MKNANRDLERAVMKGDAFKFSCSLSEGASIGYKSGAFFPTACRLGSLDIVEMFLLEPTFLSKARKYYKELNGASFHVGITYAIARGQSEIVNFLVNDRTYNKLPGLNKYIVEGLHGACRVIAQHENDISSYEESIVCVLKKSMNIHNKIDIAIDITKTEDFLNHFNNWTLEEQTVLRKIQLRLELENILEKKVSLKSMKI